MRSHASRLHHGRLLACLALTGALASPAFAVAPWERWTSDPLVSSNGSLTELQAYRTFQVEATFWKKTGTACTEPPEGTCINPNTCYKGFAFWDGNANNKGRFLLRSAFPSGTWCWKTCLLPKSRPDPNGPSVCANDSGLNKNGEVTPAGAPSAPSPLYSSGFLKAPANKRNLTVWNGQTPFVWLGDTAWNAPINYAANRQLWADYVTKRARGYEGNTFAGGGGFTNVMVAPAVQTVSATPTGGFRGFKASGSCGGAPQVVPSSCHYWDSAYWQDFDNLVKVANDAGLVVVVADVMDPLNRGGSNQQLSPPVLFPARADAKIFARNLASRLAGSFVVFSPSYDARVGDATAETGVKVADLIEAVGTAIKTAAPRHLVGVHLAGGSALGDYDRFQDAAQPWLSFQLFQSGHGGGTCESGVGNDYAQFACRARKFALRFRCIAESTQAVPSCSSSGAPAGKPLKAAVNVEGQYETPGDNETRIQTRHTGWNSGLSGSFGFNIGVFPDIAVWNNPGVYSATNHKSDDDLGRMKGLFKSLPWTGLTPRSDMLVEQNDFTPPIPTNPTCKDSTTIPGVTAKADWLQLWRPYLALDVSGLYGLAYLPRPAECKLTNGATYLASRSIVINRAKANAIGLSCATWMGKWVTPAQGGFAEFKANCTDSNGGPVTFTEPTNQVLACGAKCDRVLRLTQATNSAQNAVNLTTSPSTMVLDLDIELSEDGLSSTILGQLRRNGLPIGGPFSLSGSEARFRKLPSAALGASGQFFVVWEEENDTETDDIVGAYFDARGTPLGAPFVLNETVEGQQSEPWVSADDSGNTVVTWTSYSEDDEIAGDIYARVLDLSGEPVGPELLVSSDNLGNQSMAQVQMDGEGGFVVAWTEDIPLDSIDLGPAPPDPSAPDSQNLTEKGASRLKRGGVYYRVYDAGGRARGPERRVDAGNRGRDRLSRLEVHRHGGFRIRWRTTDASGRDLGESAKEHDREGNPSGEP